MNQIKYHTKQKDVILSLLEQNKDMSLTAEEILVALQDLGTPVGKATLYRFLDALIDEGKIKKIYLKKAKTCYVYLGCDDAYRLMCSSCGKVLVIDDVKFNDVDTEIRKKLNFNIAKSSMMIQGTCGECIHEK